MPQFEKYSEDGRTLMIKFICYRCKKEHIEPLELHDNDGGREGTYGYLHNIKPPKEWKEIPYSKLLCPGCYEKYQQFMKGDAE